jgi:hypothetical protein
MRQGSGAVESARASWLHFVAALTAPRLQSVHHPNIIQCMDIFMENNELYMVLELANG